MQPDEKTCPKCAETVKSAATVCRFCQYDFKMGSSHGGAKRFGEVCFLVGVVLAAAGFFLLGPLVMWTGVGLFLLWFLIMLAT